MNDLIARSILSPVWKFIEYLFMAAMVLLLIAVCIWVSLCLPVDG